jgi:hypothetical protein
MDPPATFKEIAAERIGPRRPALRWMRPLCRWGFEAALHVDGERINLERLRDLTSSPRALTRHDAVVEGKLRDEAVRAVCGFVKGALKATPPMEATAMTSIK